MKIPGSTTYDYPTLVEYCSKEFKPYSSDETVDSINHYKTNVLMHLRIRGGLTMAFATIIKPKYNGIRGTIDFTINITKIYFFSILFGLALGSVFFFVHTSFSGIIAGLVGTLLLLAMCIYEIHLGIERLQKSLKREIDLLAHKNKVRSAL